MGGMLSVFLLAAGGTYPRKYSTLPRWEGGVLSFSFGPRGLTRRKHSTFPYDRGGVLSFFFRSPPGPNHRKYDIPSY